MVSLFGIKFGSDRKKARQAPKLAAEARDGKWARIDECTLGSGQYFGHNFSRPQPHRPSTSHSSAAPWSMKSEQQQSSWRVLRHHASAAELRAGEAAPHPLRQHGPRAEWAARQRSPLANGGSHAMSLDLPPPRQTSPASSLDVPPHRQQSLPSLDLPPPRQKSPSTSLDLPRLRQASPSSLHGPARQTTRPSLLPPQPNLASFDFPSPPRIDDACFPPSDHSDSSFATGTAIHSDQLFLPLTSNHPTHLPRHTGPSASTSKRETFAFNHPRRPTITISPDEAGRIVRHTQQPEGFCGNFADFDFGEAIAKPIASSASSSYSSDPDSLPQPPPPLNNHHFASSPGLPPSASAPSCLRIGRPAQAPTPPSTSPPNSFHPTPGFTSRLESVKRTRAPPPQPLRPTRPLYSPDSKDSPYGPSTDASSTYIRNDQLKAPRPLLTPRSPLRPCCNDVPKHPPSRSLARSRPSPLNPPSHLQVAAPDSDLDSNAPAPWPQFDAQQPRRSAIPPPLATPNRSPALSAQSSATSAIAPRLPSPSFPALAVSFPKSNHGLAQSLELCLDGLSPSIHPPPQMQLTPESAAYIDVPKSPGGFI